MTLHDSASARLPDKPRPVTIDRVPAHNQTHPGRGAHHGRLFRKYLLLILTLVSVALVVSGAISVYFSYQEHKSALAGLQHEKAVGAASRIEQYMRQISQQLSYAALPQLDSLNAPRRPHVTTRRRRRRPNP